MSCIAERRAPALAALVALGGGVIVDDLPAGLEFSPYKCEVAADGFVALELPTTKHQSVSWTERGDFEFTECELAHGFAIGVTALIPVTRGRPAALGFATGTEGHLFAVPVRLHEGVDIAFVPGDSLLLDNRGKLRGERRCGSSCAGLRGYFLADRERITDAEQEQGRY